MLGKPAASAGKIMTRRNPLKPLKLTLTTRDAFFAAVGAAATFLLEPSKLAKDVANQVGH